MLVEEAGALKQHRPSLYNSFAQDMPEALAHTLKCAAAACDDAAGPTAAVPQHGLNSSTTSTLTTQTCEKTPEPNTMPARSASSPYDALDSLCTAATRAVLGHKTEAHAGHTSTLCGVEQSSQPISAAATARCERPFGVRSFMRSRTLSDKDISGSKGGGGQGGAGAADDGGRCVTENVAVQPQKAGTSFLQALSRFTPNTSEGQALLSKPNGAVKLLEAFRLGKKGKEHEAAAGGSEEGGPAELNMPGLGLYRASTRSSEEHNYVLLGNCPQ